MAVVETRISVWEALAGRAPGQPAGPAEPGLWSAVVERLNPARAKPVLRPGVERVELVSVRDVPYVMLKSPDDRGRACYLRLTPEEWRLTELMDGTRTVARLVAEFARIAGRLAPEQVTRIVADLAGNRMLAELPVDAFRQLDRVHRRPWPVRLGRGLLAAARGRRMVLANVDRLVDVLYRAGGRWLFHRAAAVTLGVVAVAGLLLFGVTWWRGDQSLFLTGGSYAAGAAVLLGLNVLALACHELGHALATRHAGRRVPAAGFLIYFGIPSVFVDTTDVWMAGRRARMITTAAGPAAGLVLAGVAQLVGLLVPAAAPWTFKLAFAWYLNALFNLNPFLALDGYYLLMDWLEIPNLRARGLAFVLGRLRRRPPRWSQLDREGRLVALYGMLAVLWLVIAVNIGWRIWSDRVSGLTIGLWRAGWPARLLLAAVVVGLAAPLVYLVVGWLTGQVKRAGSRLVERRHRTDTPRRLDLLRRSALGRLPTAALAELAAYARWTRPRTGQQLVLAGAAQSTVWVVADGTVEGRRPNDPGGTVRQRLGIGGVVGLAEALRGTPATLGWHTAGTTLLAIPAPVVARTVGPLPGPPPADRAVAEALFGEAPALAQLTPEERMGLVCAARPVLLGPGDPVVLAGPNDAVVVESGVVALPDGAELRRGTLIGPAGEGYPGVVATARTPVRLWALPAMAGLNALLGGHGLRPERELPPSVVHEVPTVGVHPVGGYPPLTVPPGPPPPGVESDVDRRFERRLWWLVLLFLLLALLVSGANLIPGPAWAEMPTDRALLTAEQGRVVVATPGGTVVLNRAQSLYVGEGDRIEVAERSLARLTFRGGADTLLCAWSAVDVGPLWSDQTRPIAPNARLTLDRGRIVPDTRGDSSAFQPLTLAVSRPSHSVVNRGAARYAVTGRLVEVQSGEVRVDGIAQPPSAAAVDCGGSRPAGPVATPTTGQPTPESTPSATPPPSPTPTPALSSRPPTPEPEPTRTRPPRTTPPPTRTPTPTPPPPNQAPVFGAVRSTIDPVDQLYGESGCNGSPVQTQIVAEVSDPDHTIGQLTVSFSYQLTENTGVSGSVGMTYDSKRQAFVGALPVVSYGQVPAAGETFAITVRAQDPQGADAPAVKLTVGLRACWIIG